MPNEQDNMSMSIEEQKRLKIEALVIAQGLVSYFESRNVPPELAMLSCMQSIEVIRAIRGHDMEEVIESLRTVMKDLQSHHEEFNTLEVTTRQ